MSAALRMSTVLKCPEVFGNVQVTQYVPMNSELSDFETHVNLALEGITTSANPQLVISLGSLECDRLTGYDLT